MSTSQRWQASEEEGISFSSSRSIFGGQLGTLRTPLAPSEMQKVIIDLQCLYIIGRSMSPSTAPLFVIAVPVLNKPVCFPTFVFLGKISFFYSTQRWCRSVNTVLRGLPWFSDFCFVSFFPLQTASFVFFWCWCLFYHALMDIEMSFTYLHKLFTY